MEKLPKSEFFSDGLHLSETGAAYFVKKLRSLLHHCDILCQSAISNQ
jgi:hypothetical protein